MLFRDCILRKAKQRKTSIRRNLMTQKAEQNPFQEIHDTRDLVVLIKKKLEYIAEKFKTTQTEKILTDGFYKIDEQHRLTQSADTGKELAEDHAGLLVCAGECAQQLVNAYIEKQIISQAGLNKITNPKGKRVGKKPIEYYE